MKALISPFFGKFVAEDVKEHFSEHSNVYIGVGRSVDFGSSVTDVDPVVYSTIDINSIYRNLIGLKKIQSSDMQLVVPNDRDFIQLLQTLAIFLTGALGGVLAGNGLKSKPKDKSDTPNTNAL